jgi:integrase/recombinase XerD
MMLSLIYSCGLRVATGLEPVHIDSKGTSYYQNSKEKDRIVPLSPKILEMLRDYYKVYKPTVYLFEGRTTGLQYDAQSLQLIIKQALQKQESQSLSLCIGCGTVMQLIY